jgi:large subunit ribosomal protein L18
MAQDKQIRRKKIHYRIRKTVVGSATRPRLSVYRSNKEIYAQLVDDLTGSTLASASTFEKGFDKSTTKVAQAEVVGKTIAQRAAVIGIENVQFDRSGYLYHGRVKALAEGAREGGLKF